jgi:hypothetical protein
MQLLSRSPKDYRGHSEHHFARRRRSLHAVGLEGLRVCFIAYATGKCILGWNAYRQWTVDEAV